MNKKGSYYAAWISGFFISFVLLISACSDKENKVISQDVNLTQSQTPPPISIESQKESAPLSDRPPFSQLILKKISIDYPYNPDASFKAYINKLRARIDNKNMRTMQGELSPHFICLGSACTKGLPIAEQFESLVMGLGDKPWKQLLKIVDTKYYQQVNGHICGPARTNFIGEGREKVAGKSWGYINAKDLRLRKRPTTRSAIVTYLTHDAVKLLSKQKPRKKGKQWLEVETLQGQKGFIVEKYFLRLNPQQLCYQKVAGEWKISGFRSP